MVWGYKCVLIDVPRTYHWRDGIGMVVYKILVSVYVNMLEVFGEVLICACYI